MRRLFLNPFTVLAAAVAVFFFLKDRLGYPSTGWHTLLFLFLFGYGCIAAYLTVFLTSAWIPVLKKLTFPDAYGNKVFRAGIAYSSLLPRLMIISALALYVFDASPAGVTRFCATLLAVASAAATFPIMRPPHATTAP